MTPLGPRDPYEPAQPVAAFLDCTAGVAGDMLLAALLDAGADLAAVRDAVASLGVPGLEVRLEPSRRGGLRCARAVVTVPTQDQPARHLPEILAVLGSARLPPAAARAATDTFRLLAEAEAAVHGVRTDQVHFHEVGAADALADVVGCAVAADQLGLLAPGAAVRCSPLATGSGTAYSAHGAVPVPAPAVVQLAALRGLAFTGGELAGERTTPTGAALVGVLATPGPMPPMTVRRVGCGGGGRDTPDRPNMTRLLLGTSAGPGGAAGSAERGADAGRLTAAEPVTVVESTIDDLPPELWPQVLTEVRAAGAWDCWTTPTSGRGGRPGHVLTALCAEEVRPAVVGAIFRHTTTMGVRWSRWQRSTLPRTTVPVPVGPPDAEHTVTIKVAYGPGGERTAKPEFAEAEQVARALGWTVRRVCDAALSAYHRAHPDPGLAANDG